MTIHVSPQSLPALVLNADYRPLSYYPLSLWSWQDAVKAVFLDRVHIVAEYEHAVSSPSFSMRLPSVVCLKSYVKPSRNPAFTRFNVFLRDRFECQYCGEGRPTPDLTFDHVIPRSRGGRTSWDNVVTAGTTEIHVLPNEGRRAWQQFLLPVHEQLADVVGRDTIQAIYRIAADVAREEQQRNGKKQ